MTRKIVGAMYAYDENKKLLGKVTTADIDPADFDPAWFSQEELKAAFADISSAKANQFLALIANVER